MGKEKEIDLYHTDGTEIDFTEEPEDSIGEVLDERDYIQPLKAFGEQSSETSAIDNSMVMETVGEEDIQMPPVELDNQTENPKPEPETEIQLKDDADQTTHESASSISEDLPDDTGVPVEGESDADGSEADTDLSNDEDQMDQKEDSAGTDSEEKGQALEAFPGGDGSGPDDQKHRLRGDEQPKVDDTNEFVGLDDNELEPPSTAESIRKAKEKLDRKKTRSNADQSASGNAEKSEPATAGKSEKKEPLSEKPPEKAVKDKPASAPKPQKSARKPSPVNLMFGVILVAVIAGGVVLYFNPGLIGLTRVAQSTPVRPVDVIEPVTPKPDAVATPVVSSKHERCVAKIDEADRLRNLLLEKKNEIYELDLYYHNGITELENEISRAIKNAGVESFEAAMKIKRIELNMRTIQRRRAYIDELIKPAFWLDQGSEELFYLTRKAELDLQLTEIAGGIDLNKHIRHISAAIQKYRPSPEKLAVDPLQAKVEPLEKIWERIRQKKETGGHRSLNPKDQTITNQICAGNFERIAELTSISPRTAKCLARMKGPDLFLNGIATLEPEAAKQLFQWQGNWICLNGVKSLPPATAQHLFKWKGNWISLNNLHDFPPQMAKHLLKWEGQQLELMGLKYSHNEAGQKTLKYLALWETTGGKLFVSDKVRKEMDALM
jgi:hypothetical protein